MKHLSVLVTGAAASLFFFLHFYLSGKQVEWTNIQVEEEKIALKISYNLNFKFILRVS